MCYFHPHKTLNDADDSPPFVGAVPATLPAPDVLVVVAWPEVWFVYASAAGLWHSVALPACINKQTNR